MKQPKYDGFVVVARCAKTKKLWGITSIMHGRECHFNWAFKLSENVAKSEGYGQREVRGNIICDSEFPGCPHCGNDSWLNCGSCGTFFCSDSNATYAKCPLCGCEGEIRIADEFSIKGGAM